MGVLQNSFFSVTKSIAKTKVDQYNGGQQQLHHKSRASCIIGSLTKVLFFWSYWPHVSHWYPRYTQQPRSYPLKLLNNILGCITSGYIIYLRFWSCERRSIRHISGLNSILQRRWEHIYDGSRSPRSLLDLLHHCIWGGIFFGLWDDDLQSCYDGESRAILQICAPWTFICSCLLLLQRKQMIMPITELTGWKPWERFSILWNSEIPIEPRFHGLLDAENKCDLFFNG